MSTRPVGQELLLSKLKAKGIAPSWADQAVADATQGIDQMELARQLARERLDRLKDLPKETAQRRLLGFLMRRGFLEETVEQVVAEVIP